MSNATKSLYTIGLVGNPNCGKTTLFNALTGSRQRVGNWPGVTVEKKSGEYRLSEGTQMSRFEVVDLPGTYSLDVVDREVSLDEKVARDYVHANEADLIINIVDASNLERNLYLTSQLAEMRVPLLVVLNMVDVAEGKGMRVDAEALSRQLGCPVLPVVASEGTGIDALKAPSSPPSPISPAPPPWWNTSTPWITPSSSWRRAWKNSRQSQRYLRPLAGGAPAGRRRPGPAGGGPGPGPRRQAARRVPGRRHRHPDGRCPLRPGPPHRQTGGESQRPGEPGPHRPYRPGGAQPHLGIPIFLVMMYLMFMFTINIGGAFIDFFDQFAGAVFVDGFAELPWPAWARRNGSRCCWPRASAAACRPWPPSSR
jgi:ferrous iron transport protein B